MKSLRKLTAALVLGLIALLPMASHASPPNEAEMKVAEKRILTLPFDVSNTIYSATRYAVASPVDGWITGLYFTYEGPQTITSGTSANIVAKIGGVSLTTISITVPSGTTVLGVVSSTARVSQVSNTAKVTKGSAIEFAATGSPLMTGAGGKGRLTVEVTPNYTPARFRQ